MSASKWNRVSRSHPCPVCDRSDWCSVSGDGAVAACRRVEAGAWKALEDKGGCPYFLHRLDGRAADAASPPPRRPLAQADRADPEFSHVVYVGLQAELGLLKRHLENLAGRGLAEVEVRRRGYRSLPVEGRARVVPGRVGVPTPEPDRSLPVEGRARVARRLHRRFGDGLLRVPGFVLRERGGGSYLTVAGSAGLLIPVRDDAGRVVALVARRDDGGDGPRYSYLSSAKYGGPGPGAPAHVPLGVGAPAEVVRLTEGPLKGDVAYALSGLPTVAAPGVGSWRPCVSALKALGAKAVRVAFDRDAWEKPHVARALGACAAALASEGFAVELERWPAAAGKGVDDVLAAGACTEVLTGGAAQAAIQAAATAASVRRVGATPPSVCRRVGGRICFTIRGV